MRMRVWKWDAYAHLIYICAYASGFHMSMRTSFSYAQAHLIFICVCAPRFHMRMRTLFSYAQAHLIIICACASHFPMRMRISFSFSSAHLDFIYQCVSHFHMPVRISFSYADAHPHSVLRLHFSFLVVYTYFIMASCDLHSKNKGSYTVKNILSIVSVNVILAWNVFQIDLVQHLKRSW